MWWWVTAERVAPCIMLVPNAFYSRLKADSILAQATAKSRRSARWNSASAK
jgi:hypothetical protein